MAKKSGEFSFDDLNKEMTKNSKWGGLMSDGGGVSEITEFISTGNYACNACLTGDIFGGIPNNRITCFSGESGCGKTFLLLNLAREAQKKGIFVIWYDSENAIERSQVVKFGIDPSKFRYEPVGNIFEFKTNITQTLELLIEKKEAGMSIPKVLFVLDSIGNLSSLKELQDAKEGNDKADMTRPKTIRSIFRIICSKMGVIGATFAFSNHIYQTLDLFSQNKQSGGQGLVYGASVILNLSKAKLKEGTDNVQTGIIVTAKPEKNRFCKPETVKFYISYVNGMNPYVGLEAYISFERCGIQRGKFITEKEYDKSPNEDYIRVETPNEIKYFVPSETARGICLDDGNVVPLNKLFTKQVFTRERLERLNEYIKNEFKYSDTSVYDLFEDDIDEEESENSETKIIEQSSDDMIKNQLYD